MVRLLLSEVLMLLLCRCLGAGVSVTWPVEASQLTRQMGKAGQTRLGWGLGRLLPSLTAAGEELGSIHHIILLRGPARQGAIHNPGGGNMAISVDEFRESPRQIQGKESSHRPGMGLSQRGLDRQS